MQINRKSFGTLKSDRYGRVTVMDEWPLRQVLLYNDFTKCLLMREGVPYNVWGKNCGYYRICRQVKSCYKSKNQVTKDSFTIWDSTFRKQTRCTTESWSSQDIIICNIQTMKCSLYIPRMTQFFVHDSIESSCLICIQYCFDAFVVEVWVLLQVKHKYCRFSKASSWALIKGKQQPTILTAPPNKL